MFQRNGSIYKSSTSCIYYAWKKLNKTSVKENNWKNKPEKYWSIILNPEPWTKIQFAENWTYEGYSTIIIDNLEK